MTDEMNVDWFRVCIAINGFRALYGHWPTMIHLPTGVLDPIFKPATLALINNRINIIYDDSYFITQDDQGNRYSFKTDGFIDGGDIDARDWLGVAPDINSIEEDTIPKQFYAEVDIAQQELMSKPKEKAKKQPPEKKPREKIVKEKKPKEKKIREKKVREKKPKTSNGKRHPIWVILSSEILLVIFGILYMLLAFALNYQGQCIKSGTLAPCTIFEYLYQVLFLIPGRLVNMVFQYWYVVLVLAILFPLIGLVLNRRKGKKQAAAEEQRLDQM